VVAVEDKKDLQRGFIKVPTALLGVFIFMTAQTLGAVWFCGTFSSEIKTTLEYVLETQIELKTLAKSNSTNRYTSINAKEDFTQVYREIGSIKANVDILDDEVSRFHAKYTTILDAALEKRRKR